ncbi:MAG: amidophosphoribosyltransferase [Bacteroidales bacterium]|nr:amidophosphoribosyltransferase [Bacteroidales bacterium]
MSGFFGAIAKKDCVYDVFYGTDYHSHLGTKRAGMVFYDETEGFRRSIHSLEDGYFRTKFEPDLAKFKGSKGLGIISDTDPQPIMFNSYMGRFAIASVSRLVNIDELEDYFLQNKGHFTENFQGNVNPTEVAANLVCEENDFVAGIENVHNRVQGSCTLVILTPDRIIAARDKLGRTTAIIGKKDGAFAVASETCAFPNTGYEIEYYLGPGEIVEITAEGYRTLKPAGEKMQICSFLWVYYGYPPSYYEGINVDEVRYRCGEALAKRDPVKPDFVCGVPDSGVGHAIGYGNCNGVPYKRAYSKYTPTWPRSFMPQNQDMRDLVARMKLIPNKAMIEGKCMVFLDDSIVRGTQLKDNTIDLRRAGAKEVHMRIACPPLTFSCNFLNFSQSRSILELATRKAIKQLEGDEEVHLEEYADPGSEKYKNMVEQIAKNLGIDSLIYQELGDLIEAIGLPKEKLCTHCWDGSSYY